MAQTGFTPIQLYYSSTTTNAPTAGNLANGELAINITDGKLFYKDNANAVQVIGWKTTPATAGGTGQTSYAVGDLLYANTTTTLAKLPDVATGNALISGGVSTAPSWGKIGLTTHVSGTLPTANGGTNLTSFTSGGVVYASSTSALATGSVFKFNGNIACLSSANPLNANWSGVQGIQINGASVFNAGDDLSICANAYYDGANYKYISPYSFPSLYSLYNGTHIWSVSSSTQGANNTITWTEAMRIHRSAGVSIGNTTDPGATNLSVTGSITTGTSLALPNAKIRSAATGSIAIAGSYVITFEPIVSGILSYELELVGAGNNNTRAVYFISSRYGSVNATSLSAATQGLGATHTVTAGFDGSNNLTITIANTNVGFAETGVWSFTGVSSA